MTTPLHLIPTPSPLDDALTFFDTPGRASATSLDALRTVVTRDPTVSAVLNGLPTPTLILSQTRQIVFANHAAAQLVEQTSGASLVPGPRVGEALACRHVPDGPDGCGTTPHCRFCGLGRSQRAFGIRPSVYNAELRLSSTGHGDEHAHTFATRLAPLCLNGTVLRLCTLTDVTAARYRDALDSVFFHDVLNTAQAVQGAAQVLPLTDDPGESAALATLVDRSARALVREIESHRDLQQAEAGRLAVTLRDESVGDIVTKTVDLYRHSPVARGRHLTLDVPADAADRVPTSSGLLTRVVGNLVKNALEASAEGEIVAVRVRATARDVAIEVHNAAVMPDHVQAQVFERFFSTKGRQGRGLGTYSVRLLVTRYLNGTVSFTSAPGDGTTFVIRLPRPVDAA